MEENDYNCEVCHEFYYDEEHKEWIFRVEGNNWNSYYDSLDWTDIAVKYCFECGRKL